MQLDLEQTTLKVDVQGYKPGELLINGANYNNSIIVTPQEILPTWEPQNIEELAINHWQSIIDHQPELVILGTGAKHIFPAQHLLAPLFQQGIAVEIMSTNSACKTFRLLAGDGRKVVAALLIN